MWAAAARCRLLYAPPFPTAVAAGELPGCRVRVMSLSVFDIFKVGIGPSSSHTMGPMRAAHEFATGLKRDGLLGQTEEIAVRLYGSLALTGVGHGTDRAILAGLEGAEPETVDPDHIEATVQRIRATGRLKLLGRHEIAFDEPMQLLF